MTEVATGGKFRRAWKKLAASTDEMEAQELDVERVAAGCNQIEKLADHYEARLEEAGFFFPPEKAPAMKLTLRNLWSRMALTQADTRIFHGMLRQLTRRG